MSDRDTSCEKKQKKKERKEERKQASKQASQGREISLLKTGREYNFK